MSNPVKLRSLYRSFLRELPFRPLAEKPSPLKTRIRNTIASESRIPMEQAEQYLQYFKAQRMYATLLERYNPGMDMDDETRIKATARKVGMEMPKEFLYGGDRTDGSGGVGGSAKGQ